LPSVFTRNLGIILLPMAVDITYLYRRLLPHSRETSGTSNVMVEMLNRDSFQRNSFCLLNVNTITYKYWAMNFQVASTKTFGQHSRSALHRTEQCTLHNTINSYLRTRGNFETVRSKIGRRLDGHVEISGDNNIV